MKRGSNETNHSDATTRSVRYLFNRNPFRDHWFMIDLVLRVSALQHGSVNNSSHVMDNWYEYM